jgi:rubrerythrin
VDPWKSVDEILDFAIKNEEGAAEFYRDLAAKMKQESMREVFLGFSQEEEGHKAKLLEVKRTGSLEPSSKKVMDLKIGDYLVDEEPRQDLDYQAALVLAMKQEKAAFKMYSDLAAKTDDPGLRNTFLGLAQEEAKHKLRFEIEYDDEVLKWD